MRYSTAFALLALCLCAPTPGDAGTCCSKQAPPPGGGAVGGGNGGAAAPVAQAAYIDKKAILAHVSDIAKERIIDGLYADPLRDQKLRILSLGAVMKYLPIFEANADLDTQSATPTRIN